MTQAMKAVLTLLAALFFATAAAGQLDNLPKVATRLIAEHGTIMPGATETVAFEQVIRPGWHTYWRNPGDVGQPTTLDWMLPKGWTSDGLQWPYPKRLPVGPFMDYGYEGKVWILSTVTAPQDAKPGGIVTLTAHATWLVCKEVCIPEEATLGVRLTVGVPAAEPHAADFAAARERIPAQSPWSAFYTLGDSLRIFLAAKQLALARPTDAQFFPFLDGRVKGTAAQALGIAENGIVLKLTPDKKIGNEGGTLTGVLVLTSADGSKQAFLIHPNPGSVPPADFAATSANDNDTGFAFSLLFAFLGGLILNLMPCVLPILAMKAFALSSQAGRDRAEAVRESLAYGAGAILSFLGLGALLLALRAGGEAIGWGFQLQEPLVVAGFALLMFGVGLNLSGVFEVAGFGGGDGLTRAGGAAGSFFTGVLAVAVAAPCTAPFMAAALGYALIQPAALALAIFLSLGIGFVAPFVLIGISPALTRLLPKPGLWMQRLREGLAFAMYGTAAWLVWVLAQQSGANAVAAVLAAMVAAGFGAWMWGVSRHFAPRSRGIGALVTLIAILAALSCLWLIKSAPSASAAAVNVTGLPSEAYSAERLASLRGQNRPVFINATAAWCITCLVNDEAALSGAHVKQAFADKRIAYLVADWTRRDPAITALLAAHGRSGVPLYLYYAPGAAEPKVLPQILTEGEVLAVLQ
jgi:thiol:disulfide interchange protein